MASNEHAYLSEDNLHNPKGLSLASNDTLCSKDNSGLLSWVSKSYIKTDKVTYSGYSTLIDNYQYSEPMSGGQNPYELNVDYGSDTIEALTTVNQSKFFRVGGSMFSQAAVINRCLIQVTSNLASTKEFVVALVRYSPSSLVTTAYPEVLFEKTVNGNASNNLVFTYPLIVPTDFTNTDIGVGDHVFLMVKAIGASAGSLVYINLNIEFGYVEN